MKIIINDDRKIYAIQKEFSEMFPYLRIYFLAKSNKSGAAKTLNECRTVYHNGNITITPKMTVEDLEERFQYIYGLSTVVLRKSGKVWLETTITEAWTLEEQNKQGEALSK